METTNDKMLERDAPLRAVTVVFDYPVTFESRAYAEVRLVEARVADQLAVEIPGQTMGEFEARILARQTNMPYGAFLQLRICDYSKLSKAFAGFTHGPEAN